jgi:hypothetical protein
MYIPDAFLYLLGAVQTIQHIQQIEVNLADYSARGKDVFDLFKRPTRCVCSDEVVRFHQHMRYSRWVDDLLIWIPVYLCYRCGCRTVSILPSFALPYSQRSLKQVDRYFGTPERERCEYPGHEALRRSWYAWKRRWRRMVLMIGVAARDPPAAWEALRRWKGALEASHMALVGQLGESLLGTYRIHARAK